MFEPGTFRRAVLMFAATPAWIACCCATGEADGQSFNGRSAAPPTSFGSTLVAPPSRLAVDPVELAPPQKSPPFADLREAISDATTVPPYPVDESYADWSWQLLPNGLIYRSYLAGVKESRMASVMEHDDRAGWIWDITLGGRVGLFRFGTTDAVRPEGFQVDIEGAAMPRLSFEEQQNLVAADFRAGLPVTYGIGPWSTKLAYYHLSSHLGDEWQLTHPEITRINYVRDCLVLGQSYYVTRDLRLYGEIDWAAFSRDISRPWHFQFGADYSPLVFNGARGSPFAAINAHLRQELNYGGNVVVQAGWQWRGMGRGQLLRIGLQYYNGKSNQFELYTVNENKYGFAIWYDY